MPTESRCTQDHTARAVLTSLPDSEIYSTNYYKIRENTFPGRSTLKYIFLYNLNTSNNHNQPSIRPKRSMRAQTIQRCASELHDFRENSVFLCKGLPRIVNEKSLWNTIEIHYFPENYEAREHIAELFEPASTSMVISAVDYDYLRYLSHIKI